MGGGRPELELRVSAHPVGPLDGREREGTGLVPVGGGGRVAPVAVARTGRPAVFMMVTVGAVSGASVRQRPSAGGAKASRQVGSAGLIGPESVQPGGAN